MKKAIPSIEYDFLGENFQLKSRFKLFFLKPIFVGIFFFALFFSVILITKLSTYFLGSTSLFGFNIYDILFSLIGFVLGFLTEFLRQIKRVFSR
ncbi:MAG: hypothetical protein KDC52_02295 [Ignavibacteriae bacterium]|nr:hypothetical protein [Ignavibacteriota bacterium]MCB0750285.1 hypothetical protein [Ignavibacteriota bacterium]MCB9247142.1 hypothetical protein [Ignavibacteriales bacterium]